MSKVQTLNSKTIGPVTSGKKPAGGRIVTSATSVKSSVPVSLEARRNARVVTTAKLRAR